MIKQSGNDFNKLTWHELMIQSKTSTWSVVNFKKVGDRDVILKLEPKIWSHETVCRLRRARYGKLDLENQRFLGG